MYRIIFYFFFIYYLSSNLFAKPVNFQGLSKLSLDDIQSLTSIDIYDNDLNLNNINIILKELLTSDLIYDIEYKEISESFLISIKESDLIENIYVNNNTWIKDDIIISNLESKKNSFFKKYKTQKDINTIKNIYKSSGFQNISVTAKVEKYSEDRINLIYEVEEYKQQKINVIKFIGNNFFSDNFLNSIINSQSIKFYNFFKSGSNLNYYTFEFDKNQIISSYKEEGYSDVKVSYVLEKSFLNNNILYFYIDEGERVLVDNVYFEFEDNNTVSDLLKDLTLDFKYKLKKNGYFYSEILIDEYLDLFNLNLISNNIHNINIDAQISNSSDKLNLIFNLKKIDPLVINKINITGNSITKSKTIRSKISVEPGQYLNKYLLDKSIKNLNRYPYINDVKSSTQIDNQLVDLTIDINEQTKTGNILLAGTFNADTGAGITFGIEDKNIAGSGNSLSSDFLVNSEDLKFSINYKQYPILNPDLTNTYSIFNQDNDYTSSFGYKASTRGLGYTVNFKQNDILSYGAGFNYETFKGHSAVNNSSISINDNIGNFENYKINFSIKYDSSNNYLYPTDGVINRINFEISPDGLSDNSFYKLFISNKNYLQLPKSNNYLFFNNNYGYAKALKSKLKTIDAFSLGGLNFKGFDYKGIGPYDGSIYLGGNEYFTSSIGYGSSFIFDDKDNINIKFFLTSGSIWNSDYVTSSDIDIRTSIGTSLDFITPIGPLSFSYASPIQKKNSDKTRSFNFTLGTSF
tara:strand:- start:1349 stop:3586 length:2238 start_codon:yes stop_codon:yes gene_type:complete